MRGSLREKRDGYWEVRVDTGIDRLSGKRSQISRTVRGTKRDAEQLLNQLIAKNEAAALGGSSQATFGALLAAWIDQAEPDLAYQTSSRYRRLIASHIEPSLGSIKLRKLDVATLDAFYRSMPKKKLAPRRFDKRMQ